MKHNNSYIKIGVCILLIFACNSKSKFIDDNINDSIAVDSDVTSLVDSTAIDTTSIITEEAHTNEQNGKKIDDEAIKILNQVFEVTGNIFNGFSKTGYVKGEAVFRFFRNNLSVNYSALQYSTTEDGNLENFLIGDGGIENTIKISADWNNTDKYGDGKFLLELSPDYPKNLYFEIRGSNWIHYAFMVLNDEDFQKVKQLLLSKSKKNDSYNFESFSSTESPKINKYFKINQTSDKNALNQLDYANSKDYNFNGVANFASFYEILIYGVGTGCQQAVMIDLRDGKVFGVPTDCPACNSEDEYIDFKVNSKLIINTICTEHKEQIFNVWDEKLKKFRSLKNKAKKM